MDIKSLITIGDLPTVESTNPEQEYLLLQTPEKTGKMPLSNLPSEASKIGFDNKGTNLSSNTVQAAITELDSSLSEKVSGFTSDTYEAVTGLAYDATNKKLGLKVGADTVIPFKKSENVEIITHQLSLDKYGQNTYTFTKTIPDGKTCVYVGIKSFNVHAGTAENLSIDGVNFTQSGNLVTVTTSGWMRGSSYANFEICYL